MADTAPSVTNLIDQLLDEVDGLGFKLTLATVTASASTATTTDARVNAAATNRYKGAFLWVPAAAAAGDRIRSIASHSVSAGTATLSTNGPTYTGGDTAIAAYILAIHPDLLMNLLNDVLRLERFETTVPLTPDVADGDMQSTAVTDWTATNTTRAKTTSDVFNGARSLQLTNSAADGHGATADITVPRGRSIKPWAIGRASGASTARLRAVDTSDNSLESVSTTQEAWQFMWLTVNPGAAIEQIALWLQGDEELAVTVWGALGFQVPGARRYALPSSITKRSHLKAVSVANFSAAGDESGTMLAESWNLERIYAGEGRDDFRYIDEQISANPFQIEFGKDRSQQPIFVTILRPYADIDTLTDPTDTTSCDLERFIPRAKHLLAKRYAQFAEYRRDALDEEVAIEHETATAAPGRVEVRGGFSRRS